LRLAGAVLEFEAGQQEAALRSIAGNIAYHRRLLAADGLMISKMISVSLLRKDYQIVSELVERQPSIAGTQAALLDGMLTSLQENELDLRAPLHYEGRVMAASLTQIGAARSFAGILNSNADGTPAPTTAETVAAKCCYLANATVNRLARRWDGFDAVAGGPAATLDARKQAYADTYARERQADIEAWSYPRNAMGKLLLELVANPQVYTGYIERLDDLDGYIALLRLQVALHRQQVGAAGVLSFVSQAGPSMRSPYNGMPMRWDPATSSLVFDGRQNASANPRSEPRTHRIPFKPGG
jgi:hypothetical protein